jgi:DNA anti-recombination protein RmuC
MHDVCGEWTGEMVIESRQEVRNSASIGELGEVEEELKHEKAQRTSFEALLDGFQVSNEAANLSSQLTEATAQAADLAKQLEALEKSLQEEKDIRHRTQILLQKARKRLKTIKEKLICAIKD